MIKTSELMLGDFIHLTDGQVAQVIAIDILGNIDVEFVEEGVLNRIRAHEKDIHPIRLSEYFFLTNGFTRQFHSADKIDYFIQDLVISRSYKKCIPFNAETKHLVGTSDEEPEFYRID